MSTTSERFGKQATEVKKDLQEIGAIVKDAAQEKLEQVSEQASAYCEQGQDKVYGVACACEQFIRERRSRSAERGVVIKPLSFLTKTRSVRSRVQP